MKCIPGFITFIVGLVFISLKLEIFCCFIVSEKKKKHLSGFSQENFYYLTLPGLAGQN